MEHWKEVPGTNGAIEVSDLGRVKSNLRDGRILKASEDAKGYLRLHITLNGKRYPFKVHRLVAQAFVDNPYDKPQVNHKDGNKHNNVATNLEWVTNKENAQHAKETGLWRTVFEGAMRENESRKKKVIAIKDGQCTTYQSISEAERALDTRHITDVLKGQRQQAKGYRFVYAEGGDDDVHLTHKRTES